MQEINLKLAVEEDLALISTLATRIWKVHYTPIIGKEQVDYMLEKMYSQQNLKDQVTEKKHIFYFIQSGSRTLGFISVHREQENEWFLNKFYLLSEISAKGFGSMAFDALLHLIHAKKITLTVNRQNYKSINFYFKNGFKIKHVADFDIGGGFVMNDFVMVWEARSGK